jgi:5-methylcytosine-specific restriction endonuclease McrA
MTATASPVLFLDAGMRKLRVASWQEAITDLFLDKVEVIVYYSDDRTIRTVNREFKIPAVVRVLNAFKRERMPVKFSRLNIHLRDDFVCQYCRNRFHTEALTFDHVLPRSRGGKTTWENIVSACKPCNRQKADNTPEEAGMKLLRRPRKPPFLPSITVDIDVRKHPSEWKGFWSDELDQG